VYQETEGGYFLEDIVQIKMDTATDNSAIDSAVATLRYGDYV
jgi:hypothetical protein